MTQPGGHGNDINLAALWVPVMPETSHMGEEMRKAGGEAKRQFEQGFNSGLSPEAMGQSYGSKLAGSLSKEFKNFDLPYGLTGFLDKFSGDVDEKLVKKLRGEATQALQTYRQEFDNLGAAQARAADVETRLNTARDAGINKASIILPLISEQTAAQKNLTEAHTKATGALDNYNTVNGKLSEEMGKAADGGKIMAGIMGGAVVLGAQLAVHAVESFVEVVAEGFEKSIELTVELAKSAVELGETYEHIGIQIHEFSSTTGEDFEGLESSAQRVFSTLDVAGNDTGKTMAQLSSILGTSGESIANLVSNITELQGRYTTLKATDLGSAFLAFKVPAEEADSALASLLRSARDSGQDLGQLASTLSGNVAITLHEAGLNIEQAGKFTADLMKMGEPGRQAMTGMAMAMKDFGQEGLSFSEGMKLAGQRLQELGDTAEGQELAQKLFGARNWVVAKDAVQDYLDIINQAPNAFGATTASTQEFLDQTATLGNKVEEFKHKAMDAFKPFGDAAKNAALTGLNSISTWFSVHHTEIIGKIKGWGDRLIDLFPVIQEWVANAIELAGQFAEALLYMFQPVATTMAAAGAGFLALTGHFKDAKDLLVMTANFDPSKIGDMTDKLAEGIRNIKYDSGEIKSSWDDIADAAGRMPTTVGSGLGSGLTPSGPSSTPGLTAPGATVSGAVSPGGGSWFPGTGGGGGPGGTPAVVPLGGSNTDARSGAKALARQMFPWPESEWAAFDQLEMAEAGYDPTARNASGAFGMGQFLGHENDAYASGYSTNPATQLRTMFQYIADRYGTPSKAWAQYYQHPDGKGYYQHGGQVTDDDNDDPGLNLILHALGGQGWWAPQYREMMRKGVRRQHGGPIPLDPNWASPGDPGYIDPSTVGQNPYYRGGTSGGLYDQYPEAVNAWVLARLGFGFRSQMSGFSEFPGLGMHHGFAKGGSSGTDTVPAMLTPGEYVWDTKTVDKWGWLISALHKGFQAGGEVGEDPHRGDSGVLQVIYSNTATGQKTGEAGGQAVGPGTTQPGYYGADWEGHQGHVHTSFATAPDGSFYGLPKGTDIRQGQSGFPAWVYSVGEAFGVEASTYAGHQEGSGYNRGIDWWPKGHADMSGSSYSTEEKQRLQAFAVSVASYGQQRGGSAGSPSAWGMAAPLAFGTPRGGDQPQYPGLPGQYGGYGMYGGETEDQRRAAEKAVQEANDRAADLDYTVQQNQKRIDDLKAQLAQVGQPTKTGALGLPVKLTPDELAAADEKRKTLNDQLNEATHQLTVSQRERSEQDQNITDAQRKQQEAMFKKPSGATTSAQKVPGESAFQALGSGLLAGIGQELGFGDLFSKPPWEWGAVKLLTGAASWALGTANAWADEIGKGHTGVTGFAPIAGWDEQGGGGGAGGLLSGLSGSLGINLPKTPGVSAGPNVVQTQPGPGFGQPVGPAPGPGPVVQGDFMPINVQAGVDPGQILGPVGEQRNAQEAHLHTYTGGFPQ